MVAAANTPDLGETATRLAESLEHLRTATLWLQEKVSSDPDAALAGATPYLELFGLAASGTHLAAGALAANGNAQVHAETARFFAENLMPKTSGLLTAITSGADALRAADVALRT